MNRNLLTVVTISKADVVALTATLASAAKMRAPNTVEQIVVDGDGTAQAVTEKAGCRWLRQSNTGIANAFNIGLEAAGGEWVWFLNGGDRVHPELDPSWLLKLLATTKADIVTCGLHFDGEVAFRAVPPLRVQWPPLSCWLAHPATIVRRRALLDAGGFDPRWKIAMDFDLWLRLLPKDLPIDVLSIPLAIFDTSGLSQRPESRPHLLRESARVMNHHWRMLVRIWLGISRRMLAAFWWILWKRR